MFQPKVKLAKEQYKSFKAARKELFITYAVIVASSLGLWLAVSDILRPFPIVGAPLLAVSLVGGLVAFLAEGGFRDRYLEFRAGDFSYTA